MSNDNNNPTKFVSKLENLKNELYCTNCGKNGHCYKNCHYPVISIGIICVQLNNLNINYLINKAKRIIENKINDYEYKKINNMLIKINEDYLEKNLKYLLIKRRNSISILEFVRGKYKLNDLNYLLNLFNLMTIEEKEKIKTLSFLELWNNIWDIKGKDTDNNYKKEYELSFSKYKELKKGIKYNVGNIGLKITLDKILQMSENRYNDTEWGFPKGRRNYKEKDINCAIREFHEETNYDNKDFQILNIDKQVESYTSINNVKYKHIYYVSQLLSDKKPCIDSNNKEQTNEIGDIKWLTYNNSIIKLRNYHLEKINVLNNLHNSLKLLLLEIKFIFNQYKNNKYENKNNDLVVII